MCWCGKKPITRCGRPTHNSWGHVNTHSERSVNEVPLFHPDQIWWGPLGVFCTVSQWEASQNMPEHFTSSPKFCTTVALTKTGNISSGNFFWTNVKLGALVISEGVSYPVLVTHFLLNEIPWHFCFNDYSGPSKPRSWMYLVSLIQLLLLLPHDRNLHPPRQQGAFQTPPKKTEFSKSCNSNTAGSVQLFLNAAGNCRV